MRFKPPETGDQFQFEGDTIVYVSDSVGGCCMCGEKTHFLSLSFESWHCSEECNLKNWDDFHKALRGEK